MLEALVGIPKDRGHGLLVIYHITATEARPEWYQVKTEEGNKSQLSKVPYTSLSEPGKVKGSY